MKLYYCLIIVAVISLSVLSGCYTMVSHPDVTTKDENGYGYTQQVNFYDDCQSCHSSSSNQKYVKKGKAAPVNTYSGTDSGNYADSETEEDYYEYPDEEYYEDPGYTPYYPKQYYGDYGYYYSRPWWYDVTPPDNSGKAVEDYKKENNRTRNTDGGRTPGTSGSGMTFTNPAQTSGGNSSGSTSSSGSSSSNSTRSSSSTSSSSDSRGSSSSGNNSNNTRNTDGQRSTNSGRR